MGIIATLRQLFSRKAPKHQNKGEKLLVDWKEMYQDLQSHPLTQAKIINEQLLHTTNEELEKVNKKLNNLNERVVKLEGQEPVKQVAQPKKKTKETTIKEVVKVEKVIADANLSEQEQRIIALIKKQDEIDAETIASQFNISRSNASLKLNKMYNWGLLDKRLSGKTVFYSLGTGKSVTA